MQIRQRVGAFGRPRKISGKQQDVVRADDAARILAHPGRVIDPLRAEAIHGFADAEAEVGVSQCPDAWYVG